jgi:threonine aldolase
MANACTAAEQNAYRRWADCVDALAVCEPANQTRTVDALQVCNDALANSTTQMCQESITP